MNTIQVVALSGKAETGKDYIAKHFLRGFLPVALADHFKITVAGRGVATYEEVFQTKPPAVRKLLQEEGTERGRNVYGDMIWCRTLEMTMRRIADRWGMNSFVVTDIRFPNEVEWVQSLGGKVWRIHAPDRAATNKLSPEARAHESETALDNYVGFDGIIHNDHKDTFTVAAQVRALRDALQTQGQFFPSQYENTEWCGGASNAA